MKADIPGRRRFGVSVPTQVLAVLCLMYLVLYVERVNIATIAPAMTADLGLTNAQFGLAVSAFSYPYALIQLFGGWISDRFGTRRTLLFCGALVTAATMLTGLVGGLASLFALRLALGFGEGFAFPSATRAIATWLPVSRWGFAQGITHAAARLGNALTPPLVVAVLTFASWRGAFVALGLFNLIWVLLWFWIARDDPRSHPGMTDADIAALPPASARSKTAVVPWWRLARRIAPVTAVDFCYGWTLWVFLTWLPSFFLKSFHLDLAHSALFSAGVLLGGVAGDAVGGLVSDRIYRRTGNVLAARRNVIITGMLGAFVFLIPVVLTHDLTVVAICLSLAFFFSELVVAPIWAVPMDIAPDHAGAASGMMNFGFGLAGILSPLVFGLVLDLTGSWTAPFCASIALLLVGAGLSFLMRPDKPFDPGGG
ncbi:MFS transporter [Sphingomonas echinoides]|uniref:MFS transporter n=1 Tax=Sphingomonas echinoides TaxID=59803 RepID=UPI00241322AD|nr:MFS transporter [Sphingomonas echinoides]